MLERRHFRKFKVQDICPGHILEKRAASSKRKKATFFFFFFHPTFMLKDETPKIGPANPREKSIPWKTFEILVWLERAKNDHSREGWGCKCPRPQVNVPFYSPKIAFYYQNSPFFFQNCLFIFHTSSFVSWNCSFVYQNCLFLSQKCPIAFPNFHLVFQECLLFIYCAHIFPRIFFFSWLQLLLVQLRQLREMFVFLFCSLLELFTDQVKMPCILLLFTFKQ